MKAPRFRYCRPESLEEALELLERFGDEARVLAGGQSLLPSLNMRLSSPSVLVDINRIAMLKGIGETENGLRIGALARHAEVEHSPLVASHAPLLARAMPYVAHPPVRARGTFGGSISLADPAAEIPAATLAHGAALILRSRRGERRVPAERFFRGLYETALEPAEILTGGEFPRPRQGERFVFRELARRHGDFAIVGIAMRAKVNADRLDSAVIVLFGVADKPTLAANAAATLSRQRITDASIDAAADAVASDVTPLGDVHHDADTKMHLLRVMLRRALVELRERIENA